MTHGRPFADTLREYGALYDTLYDAVATVAGAEVVVDASKWPGQALALQRVVSRSMSLLHLVADPRGVAYSWSKTQVHRPHGGDRDSVMATHKTRATAGRWAAFQSEIAAHPTGLRALGPAPLRRLRGRSGRPARCRAGRTRPG